MVNERSCYECLATAHVVGERVARNEVQGILYGDVLAVSSEDDSAFNLVVALQTAAEAQKR